MRQPEKQTRRTFMCTGAVVGAGLLLGGCAGARGPLAGRSAESQEKHGEGVSPAEDLMREHGLLRRVLLIYDKALRRIGAGEEPPAEALADSAAIIRSFIEEYHEKLEEDYLFPRFRKAGKLVELVDTLLEQHQAGRRLTDATVKLATAPSLKAPAEWAALGDSLRQFIRMYSPHAAREDTVLFPALHEIVSGEEYDDLGERFEDKEQDLFGEGGFEKMVERVAGIERTLGIYELKQFTAKLI